MHEHAFARSGVSKRKAALSIAFATSLFLCALGRALVHRRPRRELKRHYHSPSASIAMGPPTGDDGRRPPDPPKDTEGGRPLPHGSFFHESDVVSPAPVCGGAPEWFRDSDRQIELLVEAVDSQYCMVNNTPFARTKHCPLPCSPVHSDAPGRGAARTRGCLMAMGTKSCHSHGTDYKPSGPGAHDVEIFIRTYRRDLLGGVLLRVGNG